MTLKEFREKRFISRKKMAKMAKVSEMTIYRWEVGKSKPQLDKLITLIAVFGQEILECFE